MINAEQTHNRFKTRLQRKNVCVSLSIYATAVDHFINTIFLGANDYCANILKYENEI